MYDATSPCSDKCKRVKDVSSFFSTTVVMERFELYLIYFLMHGLMFHSILFQFGGESAYLASMNDYIRQSHEKFK